MKVRLRVLIVEDEPAIARSIQILISKLSDSFSVIGIAYNGVDGLELIKKEKPQVVFSDIRMPLLSGLEMIEETVRIGISCQFIILSGYSEFEYAKKAMSFGVTEYLLKPIILEEMEKVLCRLIKNQEKEERENLRDYVLHMMANPNDTRILENPLESYDCIFFFSYYGPIANALYGNINVGRDVVQRFDDCFVTALEKKYGVYLLQMKGWRHNEVIYVLIMSHGDVINMDMFVKDLWDSIQSPEIYTNLILSEKVIRGEGVDTAITSCNLYTLFHIPFGRGGIHQCHSWKTEAMVVSEQVLFMCRDYNRSIGYQELKKLVDDLVDFWESIQVTQLQLQTDIRYCFNYFVTFEGANPQYPVNIEEIIALGYSFSDLRNFLLLELKEMLKLKEQEKENPVNKMIVYKVKEFLEENYTHNITAKRIYEKFGYNEKYIYTLYKAEFGITPGKYVCELRIDKAKRMMNENPYILLKEVSQQVGYMDALYFSRVFKSKEHISPSAYLQKIRAENEE